MNKQTIIKSSSSEIQVCIDGRRPALTAFKTKTGCWVLYLGENEEPVHFTDSREGVMIEIMKRYPEAKTLSAA